MVLFLSGSAIVAPETEATKAATAELTRVALTGVVPVFVAAAPVALFVWVPVSVERECWGMSLRRSVPLPPSRAATLAPWKRTKSLARAAWMEAGSR